jgi:hypothetical protein
VSALTDGFTFHLLSDLEGHLDAYQLSLVGTGAPLWPDATPQQAAAWYLAHSLFKKYNDQDRPGAEACAKALQKFLDCNTRNATFSFNCEYLRDEELIQGVSDEIYRFWYIDGETPLVSTYGELYAEGRCGPGASRKARANDFYTKLYDSPLSHTPGSLAHIWERLTTHDPRHFQAEQVRRSRYGFRQVEGNSLSFVNKNVDVARGIATEPTINMWFQLGLGEILSRRLRSVYGIDIPVQQDVNRALARVASTTGRLATIDLESASDSISLRLCERILPKDMLAWLRLIRSPSCRLPSGEVVELHSVSTMGNGFTFPLMTMLFCAIIVTVYKQLGIPALQRGPADGRNFAVFGDDLIVDSKAVPLLYRTLALFGFRVNRDKSYVEGPFRESCGADWFLGAPVRGVYIKRLVSVQDYAVAINNLNRWSARTGITLSSLVGALIRKASSLGKLLYGPPDESDDACVHVPLDKARGITRMQHGLISYWRWIARPGRVIFLSEEGRVLSERGSVVRNWNPEGFLLTVLRGNIRCRVDQAGRLMPTESWSAVQANGVRYGRKPRVSASWDALAPERRGVNLDWQRWSDAVRYNLP